MFRVKLRANLGLIFFTVLIQKSEKQWKVLSGCLKNLPSGIPSGHQTFPRGCAPRESLMTLGNSLGQIFTDNHCGLSTVYTRVNPGVTLGCIIFTTLIQKSEKQWKVLKVCLENLPMGGPSGNQTFLWGCAPQESLITLGTSQGQIYPDNPFGLSTVCTKLVLLQFNV